MNSRILNLSRENNLRSKSNPSFGDLDQPANYYLQTNNIEHRKGQLEKILKQDPRNADAIKELAECFEIQGDMANTIQCYTSLFIINKNKENTLNLADCCYDAGVYEMSLSCYKDALNIEDLTRQETFEIYRRLGNIYVTLGDYEAAEVSYSQAQEIDERSDSLMVNLGTLELRKDNLNESVNYFRKALSLNINNDKAWAGLGIVHREYGDNELALGNVMRALDENVYNEIATNLMIDICMSCAEPSRVLQYVKTVYERYPIESFHLLLAQLYHYSGHSQKAWIVINEHLKKYPHSSDAQKFREKIRICREEFSDC